MTCIEMTKGCHALGSSNLSDDPESRKPPTQSCLLKGTVLLLT